MPLIPGNKENHTFISIETIYVFLVKIIIIIVIQSEISIKYSFSSKRKNICFEL